MFRINSPHALIIHYFGIITRGSTNIFTISLRNIPGKIVWKQEKYFLRKNLKKLQKGYWHFQRSEYNNIRCQRQHSLITHNTLPDCVRVARQTLTLFVWVQILVGQPSNPNLYRLGFVLSRGIAQFGSVLGSGPRGRGFKSRYSDQKAVRNITNCFFFSSKKLRDFVGFYITSKKGVHSIKLWTPFCFI